MLNRRNVLAAAGLILAPRFVLAETAADGFRVIHARDTQIQLLEAGSPATRTWGFADNIIRCRQGELLKLRFVNELDRDIWLHWFGLRGPSDLMTLQLKPGPDHAVDCAFTPPDAGTFWFGPLTDASRQRDMGLTGLLIVEETEPLATIEDISLVLDDWKLTNDGVIEENFGDMDLAVAEGRLGNWFTVNNAYRPGIGLEGGKPLRLRILNAANVRTMNILVKGADPLLLALDGQPLRPRELGSQALALAPGQRADLLVVEGSVGLTLALDLFEDVVEIAYLVPKQRFTAEGIEDNFTLPPNPLATGLDLDKATIVPLVIEGGAKGGMKSAKLGGEVRDLRTLLENGMAWAFNGSAGPSPEPLAAFTLGQTVILDIDNRTAFDQPLHLHGHVWQSLATDGEAWRDTAVIGPRRKARLAFVADNPGTWALQSLVAERVDSGLLTSFTVT